jgi:hypothetical protein
VVRVTVNVVRASYRDRSVRVPFAELDTAVEFGAWLMSRGYVIDIYEDNVLAVVRSPKETEESNRLAALYACTLASPQRAC